MKDKSFPISFDYNTTPYTGMVYPLGEKDIEHTVKFKVELNNNIAGIIEHIDGKWFSGDTGNIKDEKMINAIGNFIENWYE
jgi:hypothetical protein